MAFTEQLTQALAVVGHTPAASQTAGTVYVSSPVDMSIFRRAIAYVDFGVFTSGTAVLQWFAANNVAFTTIGTIASGLTTTNTTTSVAGASIQISFSSAVTRVESCELRADQLPTGMRWAQPQITVSAAAVPTFGVIVLGGEAGYKPANQYENTGFAAGTTGVAIRDQAIVT